MTKQNDALIAALHVNNPTTLVALLNRHMEGAGTAERVCNDPSLRLITHKLATVMGVGVGIPEQSFLDLVEDVAVEGDRGDLPVIEVTEYEVGSVIDTQA